jgi:hypothetical protein
LLIISGFTPQTLISNSVPCIYYIKRKVHFRSSYVRSPACGMDDGTEALAWHGRPGSPAGPPRDRIQRSNAISHGESSVPVFVREGCMANDLVALSARLDCEIRVYGTHTDCKDGAARCVHNRRKSLSTYVWRSKFGLLAATSEARMWLLALLQPLTNRRGQGHVVSENKGR